MNIYVSNISHSATDFQLKKLFSRFGEVQSANIILDHLTNQSKGFGFIEMSEKSAAQIAIKSLDSSLFLGNIIQVSEARPQ